MSEEEYLKNCIRSSCVWSHPSKWSLQKNYYNDFAMASENDTKRAKWQTVNMLTSVPTIKYTYPWITLMLLFTLNNQVHTNGPKVNALPALYRTMPTHFCRCSQHGIGFAVEVVGSRKLFLFSIKLVRMVYNTLSTAERFVLIGFVHHAYSRDQTNTRILDPALRIETIYRSTT